MTRDKSKTFERPGAMIVSEIAPNGYGGWKLPLNLMTDGDNSRRGLPIQRTRASSGCQFD